MEHVFMVTGVEQFECDQFHGIYADEPGAISAANDLAEGYVADFGGEIVVETVGSTTSFVIKDGDDTSFTYVVRRERLR